MKIVTLEDVGYTQQTEALNEIAAKLGVVACRPDYHGSRGDKNTVMLYTPEDERHNRLVDRQPERYSRGEAADLRKRSGSAVPDKYIYRDSFWDFENSDMNGRLNMEYANFGKLNLCCADWKEKLEGHIGLALVKKRQNQYAYLTGGWGEMREADEMYNDYNRSIIAYMKRAYGRLYLGNVNFFNDNQRERICSGEESVYEEYTGQDVYNFSCTFAVPVRDETLEEMIRGWNKGTWPCRTETVDQITKKVDEIGGEHFIWY